MQHTDTGHPGCAHGSTPGAIEAAMVLPVLMAGGPIASGEDWRQTVTFRIPATAPASWYSATESVRWTLTLELMLQGDDAWRRTLPMLVFPADAA